MDREHHDEMDAQPGTERNRPHYGHDGMPQGRPLTTLVIEFIRRLEETVWTNEQRLELQARIHYRGPCQIIEFWQGLWLEHAPPVAHQGRHVRWVHQCDACAPYWVDGVHLEAGEIKAVILKDRMGGRWPALPQDLEAADAPRSPDTSTSVTIGLRTGPQTRRMTVDEAVPLFRMMVRHADDPLWRTSRTTYRHHVVITVQSVRSDFFRVLDVSPGVALLADDRRFRIAYTWDGIAPPRYHAKFKGRVLGTYATDLEAAQGLFDWHCEHMS